MAASSSIGRRGLDVFLRQAMKRLNTLEATEIERLKDDFDRAMWAARDIFQEHAFRKRFRDQNYRSPINKALFEAVSVNLAKLGPVELVTLRGQRDEVQNGFMRLMNDYQFHQAISVATGDTNKVRWRFSTMERLLREVA